MRGTRQLGICSVGGRLLVTKSLFRGSFARARHSPVRPNKRRRVSAPFLLRVRGLW